MPDTSPFGPGVLPALQTLLRFIQPHTKVIIFIYLLLNPYNGFPGLDKIPTSHPTLLILAVLALYGGYLKIPGIEITGATHSTPALISTGGAIPVPAASLEEPLLALGSLYKSLEPYFKVGFLLWLTIYVHHQSPLFSQSWPIYLFPIVITLVGYFSPTTRFYGPIRFGYLEHNQHFAQAYKILLDGWVIGLVVLPFPGVAFALLVCITGLSLAAWVRLSFSYRKELRDISIQVAKHTSRAKAAASAAHDEASSFHRYEDQVIQAATSARRDAVLAKAVRFTDFFDCATRAWAALGQVTQPAETAVSRANELIAAAADVQEVDKPDEDEEGGESFTERLAQYLQETAEEARGKANEVVSQLKVAQAAVTRSEAAAAQDQRARAAADTNAAAAITVTQQITWRTAGLLLSEAQIVRFVDDVSALAGQALSAAQGGEMARARHIAGAAKTAADSADVELGNVRAARTAALSDLMQWLQSSRSGRN